MNGQRWGKTYRVHMKFTKALVGHCAKYVYTNVHINAQNPLYVRENYLINMCVEVSILA